MSVVQDRAAHDRVLIALAIAGVGLSFTCAVVGALGLLPSLIVIVVVLAGASIALRVALSLRARRSSALSNARVMNIVSLSGLGLSTAAALTTLGIAIPRGGFGDLVIDLGAHAWSLVILVAASAPVRTIGWRAMVGVGLAGLLASSALAREVGDPIIEAFGIDDVFAISVWVPMTEELLKAAPVVIIALLAARNRFARPSAIDMALLGAFSGSGFALIENAEFGRVFADWNSAPPLSHLFPSMEDGAFAFGPWDVVAGHIVWTALFSMGIGFGVLYFRRFRFAWVAMPATYLVVVLEHGIGNAQLVIPLGGVLSALLLVVGYVTLVVVERRPLRGVSRLRDGFLLAPGTAQLRRLALATVQRRRTTELTEEAPR